MPIIDKYDLIFIHIPKNAGKSIEDALIGVGASRKGGRSYLNRSAKYLEKITQKKETKRSLIGTLDYTLCTQHLTYQEIEILRLTPPEKLSEYKKLSVVRNPYDRIISTVMHFYRNKKIQSSLDFQTLLQAWLLEEPKDHNQLAHRRTQTEYLTKSGKLINCEMIRFENIGADFSSYCKRNKIIVNELGWSGKQRLERDYRAYHTELTKKITEKYFEDDFENFKYKF
jgi:hypothetical protein